MSLRSLAILAALVGCAVTACASPSDKDPDYSGWSEDDFSAAANEEAGDYLRLVVARDGLSNTYLMHWPKRSMPLSVYLPPPPPGLFQDPEAVKDAVRRGVLEWTDVAGPGVPSFEFVDDQGDADIPIVWAAEPDGDWYIAFCAYNVFVPNRFGVSHILVTGRWGNKDVASLADIHDTMLHEMGHALGLMGHSDSRGDVMWSGIRSRIGEGLSQADRNTLRKLYEHGNRPYRGRRGRR